MKVMGAYAGNKWAKEEISYLEAMGAKCLMKTKEVEHGETVSK